MRSFSYWHPSIYSFLIKLNYGRSYIERYVAISNLIEADSSVVDICCGDCKIFDFLKDKNVSYLGLDINPYFVRIANKRGIKARQFNIYNEEIPRADYIIIQGSLYQFIPRHGEILIKMFNAASRYMIVSEPVKNRADSHAKIVSFLSERMSDPGDGIKKIKFNRNTLKETLEPFKDNIVKELLVANNTDHVVLIRKSG